jgi:oligoendopeptidase F
MPTLNAPQRAIAAVDRAAVIEIVRRETQRRGTRPLSDASWLELESPSADAVELLATHGPDASAAIVIRAADRWMLEVVATSVDDLRELVSAVQRHIADNGGGTLDWLAQRVDDSTLTVATARGFTVTREILQLRIPLPVSGSDPVSTRPFRDGTDNDAWLESNNAAFSWHPEQGGWDRSTLQLRIDSDWFNAEGFLLHDIDGRLAASCWTKIHADTEPQLGEIYVISVHPDFQGRGLGRALTIAGLDYLASRGITIGMLYVDGANTPAVGLYSALGFHRHHADVVLRQDVLPRWSVTDIHESITARSFTNAVESATAQISRAQAVFDQFDIRATQPRTVTAADGEAADAAIDALNTAMREADELGAYVAATTTTDSRDQAAKAVASELEVISARRRPLQARLADWLNSLGVDALASVSEQVADHAAPLHRLARRAAHQMSEAEEVLYSQLVTTGSAAWARLHADITSQLETDVALPAGARRMPMAAVRGLATNDDPAVRQAGLAAELAAWPQVADVSAAALNAIKGEANVVNGRRNWLSPLDASLFANSVSRDTFDALQSAVVASLPDFRAWMRTKAALHGHDGGLPWYDLFAPLPGVGERVTWSQGVALVEDAFGAYGGELGGLVARARSGRWIDAGPRAGKRGGAFCASLTGSRSLVFMNWSDSIDSTRTLAHELGHAYHNVQLAHRTPLQRQLPMSLAETASIFCETLLVDRGLQAADSAGQLAILDADLIGATQVVVDIHSRFLFESELFQRRLQRPVATDDLNQMMLDAQRTAYGDGLDQATAHPYMWVVKPHYYSSHFYNWPYTFGLLFGLGLFAHYRADAAAFTSQYDELLSRAGMDSAETLGASFGIDTTDASFWTSSLDVLRSRMSTYRDLAAGIMS